MAVADTEELQYTLTAHVDNNAIPIMLRKVDAASPSHSRNYGGAHISLEKGCREMLHIIFF